MLQWLLVFLAAFATDICWAFYVRTVKEDGKPFQASCWAAALFALAGITTISFVHDYYLLIPGMVGAWLGTYVTIWWDTRKTPR